MSSSQQWVQECFYVKFSFSLIVHEISWMLPNICGVRHVLWFPCRSCSAVLTNEQRLASTGKVNSFHGKCCLAQLSEMSRNFIRVWCLPNFAMNNAVEIWTASCTPIFIQMQKDFTREAEATLTVEQKFRNLTFNEMSHCFTSPANKLF